MAKMEMENEQQPATKEGRSDNLNVHGIPARSYKTGGVPNETFHQMVARVNANAFLPIEQATHHVQPRVKGGKKKLHRVARRALDQLTPKQLKLLCSIATGEMIVVVIGNVQYACKKHDGNYNITSLCADSHEYTVTLSPFACTCPDCKFRDHECKHVRKLKEFL
jgi:hypothetical protein